MSVLPAPRSTSTAVAELSRFLRQLRYPGRLRRNPLLPRVCASLGVDDVAAIRAAISVQLRRLPIRHRTIIERYELSGEPLAVVLDAMALSRRQFFRDRLSGLGSLATFVLGRDSVLKSVSPALLDEPPAGRIVVREDAVSLEQSTISGLRYAGAVAAAIDRLRALVPALPRRHQRVDALLQIAEISMEYGDRPTEREILVQLRGTGGSEDDGLDDLRTAIRRSIVESDLVNSCERATAINRRASRLLRRAVAQNPRRQDVTLLIGCLCLLYYDYDRASMFHEAREVANEALSLVLEFGLERLPVGVEATIALAYCNARQLGNVGAALASLREPLTRCLASGWSALAAKVGVACLTLTVMRSRYAEALQWYDWLGSVSAARLPGFDRKLLVVESSHAMTMMGQAHRAIGVLNSSSDEGYVFAPTVKIRRAEAFEAVGDLRGAIRDATDGLASSEKAQYVKGVARAHRVLASCFDAMGATRTARNHLQECMTLSERSQSAYDLLRAMVTRSHVLKDDHYRREAIGLARLLLDAGGSETFAPPAAPLV